MMPHFSQLCLMPDRLREEQAAAAILGRPITCTVALDCDWCLRRHSFGVENAVFGCRVGDNACDMRNKYNVLTRHTLTEQGLLAFVV